MITKFNNPANIVTSVIRHVIFQSTSPRVARLVGEPFFWLVGMRYKREKIDLSQIKRALVVRLDEIGDVVLTTPFLRELRQNLPKAWITLIVKPAVYNLVELCPYIDEVLTFDQNVSESCEELMELKRHLKALCLAWKHLWKRRFDLAILPRRDVDYYHSTFVAYFSGAPFRIGYSEDINPLKKRLNNGFNYLLNHQLSDTALKHEVEHNLDIIRFLGREVKNTQLELWFGEKDKLFADSILKCRNIKPDDFLVGLAPGSRESKRWPINQFSKLGNWLKEEFNAKFFIVGGPGEESLGIALQQTLGVNAIDTIGQTTLRQSAALLKHCKLFIGNDSGPMHIAAAVGVPVIELSCHPKTCSPYSSNSTFRFGPWGENHTIIQPKTSIAPCIDECVASEPHCILGISLEQVKQTIADKIFKFQLC